ncbi:hypothetical protein LJC42_06995 [Eubacteriales bacterium OttesenSCG-928-K08]|nr:hypothetical protein [Eubacteriales bacterium OttesenSCG-928-K08]
MPMKRSYTPWGLKVRAFCAAHQLTLKELAEQANVNYQSLRATCQGYRPGYDVVKNVDAIMHQQDEEQQHAAR